MIWKRINDSGKNWRHVYKALVLLEYLIKTGSEKVHLGIDYKTGSEEKVQLGMTGNRKVHLGIDYKTQAVKRYT